MELNGFYLDEARWREQLEKVKKEQAGRRARIAEDAVSAGVAQASLFGVAEINLDSQAQVTDALKNLGVPVPESTRGWQLQPLAQSIIRSLPNCLNIEASPKRFRVSAKIFWNLSNRKPVESTPIFARSVRRPADFRATIRISNKSRTKKRIAAVFAHPKEKNS